MNKSLAVGIVFLFIVSSTIPMVLGNDVESEMQTQATTLSGGPMDSPWPMKCHDLQHTGRSQYSTSDNQLVEKWRFNADSWIDGGPVIDKNGNIYFGSQGVDRNFYAIYPNGDLKWKYSTNGEVTSTPAIAEDGTIYIGDWGDGTFKDWTKPVASKEEIVFEHTYNFRTNYTIKAKAKDEFGGESDWATLEVSMPKNKLMNPFERFLENHPYLFPILRKILTR